MADIPSSQEGRSIQLFRVRLRGIFKQIADGVSAEKFEELFGEVLEGRLSRARRIHKIWQDTLLEQMVNDFDEVIADEKLDDHLKKREKMIEDCQEDKCTIAWRPPGNPKEHVRSHEMEKKIKRKQELEALVKRKEEELGLLMEKVSIGRRHSQKFDSHLNSEIDKFHSLQQQEKTMNESLDCQIQQSFKESTHFFNFS
ncbi:polyamine-modulated factor 1-like [Periplaneta americana]|uniref:polyamine-modulated factor 1-like n=1 Tax=Periplaneta americana TaxID=6978 RepID=UPI0037E70449